MGQRLAGILVLLRSGHGTEVSRYGAEVCRHTGITKERTWRRVWLAGILVLLRSGHHAQRLAGILVLLRSGHGAEVSRHGAEVCRHTGIT